MIRMEIACFLVMGMIALMYFSAEKKKSELNRTFSVILIAVLIYLCFDGVTVYTVNHLDTVPLALNNAVHRIFMGSMVFVIFLFYRYISALVGEETGKTGKMKKLDKIAVAVLILTELGEFLLPVYYTETSAGNYSDGIYTYICYICVGFYLLLCTGILLGNWKCIDSKKKSAIGAALIVELTVCILQWLNHTWLISGMGITLMTLSFYLTLENPDIIRGELVEQKMSMLYLKSQINPHFLYNTLDTIRIQAELNQDKNVAKMLMNLVDFFRMSVKVDRQMVTLDDELELLEAYMELMCYRYPYLHCEYDIDPELGEMEVPNFILQPLVENSLIHGLKNKGYRGEVIISAKKEDGKMEITICDNGSGFAEGKKAAVDEMLRNYEKKLSNLEGNSVGLLNVQKRIKLLCGKEYGLFYTDNKNGGVTAHLFLPVQWKEESI